MGSGGGSSLPLGGDHLPASPEARVRRLAPRVLSPPVQGPGGGRGGPGGDRGGPGVPRLRPRRSMAQEQGGSLSEARARVGALHGITDLGRKLHFYGRWAADYDQVNRPGFPPPLVLAQPQPSYL